MNDKTERLSLELADICMEHASRMLRMIRQRCVVTTDENALLRKIEEMLCLASKAAIDHISELGVAILSEQAVRRGTPCAN